MGWKLAFCAVAAGLAFAVATSTADAQPEKRTRVAVAKQRPVTRIIVTRRSYLDGGKEYLPGHPLPANQGIYPPNFVPSRSEEHTSELQSHHDLVCRLLLEKK